MRRTSTAKRDNREEVAICTILYAWCGQPARISLSKKDTDAHATRHTHTTQTISAIAAMCTMTIGRENACQDKRASRKFNCCVLGDKQV